MLNKKRPISDTVKTYLKTLTQTSCWYYFHPDHTNLIVELITPLNSAVSGFKFPLNDSKVWNRVREAFKLGEDLEASIYIVEIRNKATGSAINRLEEILNNSNFSEHVVTV
jgi:hypothetical protein